MHLVFLLFFSEKLGHLRAHEKCSKHLPLAQELYISLASYDYEQFQYYPFPPDGWPLEIPWGEESQKPNL